MFMRVKTGNSAIIGLMPTLKVPFSPLPGRWRHTGWTAILSRGPGGGGLTSLDLYALLPRLARARNDLVGHGESTHSTRLFHPRAAATFQRLGKLPSLTLRSPPTSSLKKFSIVTESISYPALNPAAIHQLSFCARRSS